MKNIDVKNQPRLSFGRTFEICLNGIRYRLFRSAVTVVVIAVAIAFMMNVLCEAISMQSVAKTVKTRTATRRLALIWAERMTSEASPEAILHEIAQAAPGSPIVQEAAQMGNIADIAAYQRQAQQAATYIDFFSAMDYGRRRLLVRADVGVEMFDLLQQPNDMTTFESRVAKLKIRLPNDSIAAFRTFLADWPNIKTQTLALQQGRNQDIAIINQLLAGSPIIDKLTDADGAFGTQIQQAGFTGFDDATRRKVAEQARQLRSITLVEASIKSSKIRQSIAAMVNIMPGDVNAKVIWSFLSKRDSAVWYLERMKDAQVDSGDLTADTLLALAREKRDEAALNNAARLTTEVSGGLFGLGSRMTWLVLVSLLLCAVGISNAMLMSVTERFREIATLKCLGSLDGFIMLLFVMEACLLGMVGGILGSLAGSIIGFGRMAATFGGILFSAFPVGAWLSGLGIAIVVGMVLAAIAGVYPSYMAARLAPMEAMRIE